MKDALIRILVTHRIFLMELSKYLQLVVVKLIHLRISFNSQNSQEGKRFNNHSHKSQGVSYRLIPIPVQNNYIQLSLLQHGT